MTRAHSQALDQALAALRAPGLFLRLRESPLPDDLLFLLRIAAGEAEACELAVSTAGETAAVVAEAAVLFIQQVMFYPGSDSYRLLGVSQDSPDSQIKEHHRWLLRWLHPDRNTDQWEAVYADRVNRAWQDLRTPERRRDYEATQAPAAPMPVWQPASSVLAKPHSPAAWPKHDEFAFSSRTARRLPMLIMGGLVVAAIAVLAVQYQLNRRHALANLPAQASSASPEPSPAPMPMPLPVLESPRPIQAESVAAVAAVPDPPVTKPIVKLPHSVPAPVKTQVLVVPVGKPGVRESVATRPPQKTRPLPEVTSPPAAAIPAAAVARVATVELPAKPEPPQASPVATVAAPSAPASGPLINAAIARQVILRFRSAYSSGNIKQFRDLLASAAPGDPGERRMILRTYSKLFETSASRRIEIHNPDWLMDGDTAVLIATYDAWIVPRGHGEERHFFGNIRFDLRSEDGELRVARLRHDSVGG